MESVGMNLPLTLPGGDGLDAAPKGEEELA
jgi:hypothetical protein